MKTFSAQQVYDELIKQGIKDTKGKILFSFVDTEVTISAKSPYGYVFQDWLAQWFRDNDIYFEEPHNSQEFPDFYLDPNSHEKNLLEIKTFDYEASPNFDVANFEAYINSVSTNTYRLDADYLIFGYSLKDSYFMIEDVWLKKIWEICCPSERFPIRCQVKRDMIYNIRPATWYSESTRNSTFSSKDEFIEALYKTLKAYKKTSASADIWFEKVKKNLASISSLH